jgi:hypothetical protein
MEPEWNSSTEDNDAQMLGLRNHTAYLSISQLECGKLCDTVQKLLKKSNINQQDAVLCLEIKLSKIYQ